MIMRFERVLLVPVAYFKSSYKPGDVPDLALGYLAEYLKANGVDYDVLDLNLGYGFDDLVQKIREYKPDLLGIAMKSYRFKDSYALMTRIKEQFPELPIAVGAAHISTAREKVMNECPVVDFGIVKEGEDTLLELCQGKPLSEIKGLFYRENGTVLYTGDRPFKRDIQSLPWPKYEKFELKKYWYPGMVVLSSRGCPQKCVFCAVPIVSGNWWRFRTPESMVEEVVYWHEKGYRRIEFLDDNFTFDMKRIITFCDLISEKKLPGLILNVPQGIRADRVNKELLQKMKKARFEAIIYGVEVGNNKMLDTLQKGESLEVIDAAIRDAIEAGFDVHLNMMVGFPDQTLQDVEDTFAFALRYPIRWASFNNFVPYYGTPGFDDAEKRGLLLVSPMDYLNDVNQKAEQIIVSTPHITADERRYIEKKIPLVQREIRKRYHIRRLMKDYGIPGKVAGTLLSTNILPYALVDLAIKLKNKQL